MQRFVLLRCDGAQIFKLLLMVLFMSFNASSSTAAEEKVFRTGIQGSPRYFSVSPGGEFLVFDTGKPLHGLHLLNLKTGAVGIVPAEQGRVWEMANIASNGLEMVAVSTGMVDGKYNMSDMKLIVVSLKDWSWQQVSPSGDGVKITPFYAQDARQIYYFKGAIRKDRGATPASRYDLYVVKADGKEERLTERQFYEATAGDVSADGRTVYFGRYGGEPMDGTAFEDWGSRSSILELDVVSKAVRVVLQSRKNSEYVQFSSPELGGDGLLYFFAVVSHGGSYEYHVVRSSDSGGWRQSIATGTNGSRFHIAKRSGDIYISDVLNGEVVFRQLVINTKR
ncbi:MAG: hypothetical protein KBD60_10400 [Sterolibacterium sp.]|jgi:Tol biopolymer transport system component|nr:hypothetical protein [Sterolibacterium sp.]